MHEPVMEPPHAPGRKARLQTFNSADEPPKMPLDDAVEPPGPPPDDDFADRTMGDYDDTLPEDPLEAPFADAQAHLDEPPPQAFAQSPLGYSVSLPLLAAA